MDKELTHCPGCHQNVKPIQWLCGCIRCPNCSHCFKPCLPFIKLEAKIVGVCSECGKDIIKYVPKKSGGKRNESS